MVFYDQRGHGQSGEALIETTHRRATRPGSGNRSAGDGSARTGGPGGPLDGRDDGAVPRPTVPANYGRRIVGAAIISLSRPGRVPFPARGDSAEPALEAVRFAARYSPGSSIAPGGATRKMLRPILNTASFGDDRISRSVAAFNERMIHATPVATLVEFLHALEVHDETAALPY